MEKKDSSKEQEIKSPKFETRKRRNPNGKSQRNDKPLPWWVELCFVQIGLPDKWLVKILKAKKITKEVFKEEKKLITTSLFFFLAIIYLYPVIQYSKTKIQCQRSAKKYILENKSIQNIDNQKLRMVSVNFCHGGNEIDELKGSRN